MRKLVAESSRIRQEEEIEPQTEIESVENDTWTIAKNQKIPSPDSGRLTSDDFKDRLESTLKTYPKIPPGRHNVTEVAPGFPQFDTKLPNVLPGGQTKKKLWTQRREQTVCAIFIITIFLQLISCVVQDWYRFGSIKENSSIEVARSEMELRFVF